MLVPHTGSRSSLETLRNTITTTITRNFPTRKLRTSLDREKDGVWIWWEVRP